MKKNNKGFTLAELLIVVAIIAILVAIAIPVFTKQMEKSRDTTSIANLRSAYAEAAVVNLDGEATSTAKPSSDGQSVTVSDVNILSTDDVLTTAPEDLPFDLANGKIITPASPKVPGKYNVTFKFDPNSDGKPVVTAFTQS